MRVVYSASIRILGFRTDEKIDVKSRPGVAVYRKSGGSNDHKVKLPAHRAGLPGKEISFILCPLTPPTRRGLRGTCRSRNKYSFDPGH